MIYGIGLCIRRRYNLSSIVGGVTMKKLLAIVFSLMTVVSASADQTALTSGTAVGCKAKSDQEMFHQLLTDNYRVIAEEKGLTGEALLHKWEEEKAAHAKFSDWLHAHEQDGTCHRYATDTKVVIDEQSNQLACVRVPGESVWMMSSPGDYCYRIRTHDACYFNTEAEVKAVEAEKGNVKLICKWRRSHWTDEDETNNRICAQRYGDLTACVWVSTDDLH